MNRQNLFLVALGVFFPIYLNTLHGIRTSIRNWSRWTDLCMTDGELFRRVVFPVRCRRSRRVRFALASCG